MKTLTYNMDEQKILYRSLITSNPGKEQEINNIINNMAKEKPFEDYTFILKFDNGNMYVKFINNRTGKETHQYRELPVPIRNLYHELFNKLYFKYCQ